MHPAMEPGPSFRSTGWLIAKPSATIYNFINIHVSGYIWRPQNVGCYAR